MFCGNSVLIGMIILLIVGYLVVYGSSSTTIREGLFAPPCPKNWWETESQTKGLCVQTCPSDSQTRDADGRCKCGLGAPNQSCIAGTVCVNNVCIANADPDKSAVAASTSTMKCPAQFPHLLEYAPQKSFFCYKNADGNTTGAGGLCNCNCSNCGYNDNFENCIDVDSTASCSQLCPVDAGLAYLEDGPAPACIANTSAYRTAIRAATLANPKGMAFGQQSNGCWHILQWAPTSSQKKNTSNVPEIF